MKKSVIKALGLIIVAALAFTGCKKAVEYDYDPGVVVTDPVQAEPVVSDLPEQDDQVDDEQDTTDTEPEDQTIVDDIGEVDDQTGEDENLPEWMAELENTLEMEVCVINLCGVDIGMVSILDPYTEEQIDLGSLPADQIMNITEYWPKEKNTFDIAIYNMGGELVATSEIDITGIQKSVTITFSGDGDLENVDSRVE